MCDGGCPMLNRLARLAKIFDEHGRFMQADYVTSVMNRIAQSLELQKSQERRRKIEERLNDFGETIPGETSVGPIHEIPKKHKKQDPYKQPMRPGLQDILTPMEREVSMFGGKRKLIQVPTLDLSTPENRDKARRFYTEQSDDLAGSPLEQLDIMDEKANDPRVQNTFYPYGELGLFGPYLRTLTESKGGGKHNITPWFLDSDMAEGFAKQTRDTIMWALSDPKKRARIVTHYFGSDPGKMSLSTLNDLTFDLVLEQMIAPGAGMLAALRAAKAIEEEKDPNTRQLYPDDQYRAFHTSWLKQLNPKTKEHEKIRPDLIKYIDDLIMNHLKKFSSLGIGLPEALDTAMSSTIGEGMKGKGGLKTYTYPDTGSIEMGSEPGGNQYPTYSQMRSSVLPDLVKELLGKKDIPEHLTGSLGQPYADMDVDQLTRSLKNPVLSNSDVLTRIAENLDKNNKYAAADFITKLMNKLAQISTVDDVADILHSEGEEAPEDIPPFQAKMRPGIEQVLDGDLSTGGHLDFIHNADAILGFLKEQDPQLAKAIGDIIDPTSPGRKQPGELIYGPHTISVPQNKTKIDLDTIRSIFSTPDQLAENQLNYWKHNESILNERYNRARTDAEYWGKSSHNTHKDRIYERVLGEALKETQSRIEELESVLRKAEGKEGDRAEGQKLETPSYSWDKYSLDFFDPNSPNYDPELMNLALKTKEESIRDRYSPTSGLPGGIEDEEEKSLALPSAVLRGVRLPVKERTPLEEQLASMIESKPDSTLPEGLKMYYPSQTFSEGVHKRGLDETGKPIRNRYPLLKGGKFKFFDS